MLKKKIAGPEFWIFVILSQFKGVLGWFPTKIEAIKDSIVANDKALDGKEDKVNDLKI